MKDETPSNFIQSFTLPQSHKRCSEGFILNFFCWFFSIVVWSLIGLIIEFTINNRDSKLIKKFSIALFFYYLVYLILQYYSHIFKYLLNKDGKKLNEVMGEIFKMKPEVIFTAESYHYIEERYSYTDDDGHRQEGTRTVKVSSGEYSKSMDYRSFRDVSGLLVLYNGKERNIKKPYIQLEIHPEINFADTISYYDYEKGKKQFYQSNKNKDDYTNLSEKIIINGLKHHYLLKINDNDPCSINIFWYIFFSILSLGQLYKIYFSTFCIFKKIKIRKIISTRYDLGEPEFGNNYEPFNPQISFGIQKISYEPNNYIQRYEFNPGIPSQHELGLAKIYENKIPKYQIYNGWNNELKGTVQDNPDFNNLNENNYITPSDENMVISGKLNSEKTDELNPPGGKSDSLLDNLPNI